MQKRHQIVRLRQAANGGVREAFVSCEAQLNPSFVVLIFTSIIFTAPLPTPRLPPPSITRPAAPHTLIFARDKEGEGTSWQSGREVREESV